MRRLSVLAGAALVALALAAAAGASQPTVQVQEFNSGGTSSWMCGFDVTNTLSVEVEHKTFYDEDGTAVRRIDKSRATGTYTGPTGLVATYDQAMNSVNDLLEHTQTVTGNDMLVTAPGVGVLLQAVGRIEYQLGNPTLTIIFEAGQHDAFAPGAWAPVCEYLAGS